VERVPLGLPGDYKPCIAALPGGELLVVAFRYVDMGGGGKFCAGGTFREAVILFRSNDGGRTWSEAEVLAGVLGREPYLSVLKTGDLLMTGMLGVECRNTFGFFPSQRPSGKVPGAESYTYTYTYTYTELGTCSA